MAVRDDGSCFTVECYDPRKGRSVYVGRVPIDAGKKREARECADAMFRDAKERLRKRKRRPKGRTTAAGFADLWLEDFPRPAASTRNKYAYALKVFKQDFGEHLLRDIEKHEAHAWATKTAQGVVYVVRAMFTDAVKAGFVGSNPFADMRQPASRGRKDLDPRSITPALVDQLCAAACEIHGAHGEHFASLIRFAAYTGLRVGELMALEWEHVDTKNDEIRIVQHTDMFGDVQPNTKMGHSPTVVLFPEARAALPDRMLHQSFVFHNTRGERFKKGAHYYLWHPVRSAVRPGMDFHELRHLCATWMLDNGASYEQVALQLGHIDKGGRPNTVLVQTTYGHPDLDKEREALKRLFRAPRVTELRQAKEALRDVR